MRKTILLLSILLALSLDLWSQVPGFRSSLPGFLGGDTNISGALMVTGAVTRYNGQTTAGNGLASVLAYSTADASGASIGTTTLFTTGTAGLYRISAYGATSTAGTGNVITTLGWTDAVGAKTSITTPGVLTLTAGSYVSGSIIVPVAAAAAITYATTYTATGNYNIYVTVERLQ